ncbi:hypothetical protein S7711_09254 [Stachybotrys chartarum IBT 7711]|uniref:BTB domain-containing protein n=1 Tax=Stachybotrys chartarum (strain CBS 109288 / IBT 7711) TaxID=1280523 RepID=A0A084ALP9_STACB|nr:hypothetical protein S7711_09254 [Stachybotrys chartarum IBT 7711]
MADSPRLNDMSQLMQATEYSDMALICQGIEFKVHRVIVCTQSPVLAAAMRGGFKESQTGIVVIENFPPETVRCMVEFFYTGDYRVGPHKDEGILTHAFRQVVHTNVNLIRFADISLPDTTGSGSGIPKQPSTGPSIPSISQHVQINAIADYYNIQQLTKLANAKIRQLNLDEWNAQEFIQATKETLSSTGDRSLHEVMALAAAQNISELLKFDEFIELIGHFGADVLRHHIKQGTEEISELRLKTMKLQIDLDEEQTRVRSMEMRAERIIANINGCIQTLNNTNHCRNTTCTTDFDCFIEQRGQSFEPVYTLRCATCRCRH